MNQPNDFSVYANSWLLSVVRAVVLAMLLMFDVVSRIPRKLYHLIRKKLTETAHLLRVEGDRSLELELQRQIEQLAIQVDQLKVELEKKESLIATLSLKFMQKNELTDCIREKLQSALLKIDREGHPELHAIQKLLKSEEARGETLENINAYMEEVHGGLIQRLKSKFPKINALDIRLCIYLRMNLTTKEIARLSNMTIRGIEAARYRLRKKLNIDSDTNLADFILSV